MPDEMTGTDTSTAPASVDQGTQTPQSAPAAAPANADGAGSQGVQTPAQEPASAPRTPMGELMAAAEGQQQSQQAQLLAGKFKTPQDLEKGYLEAQKFISRASQEKKQMEAQLQQIQAATQGRQQQQEGQARQKDPFMEQWAQNPEFGPLAKMPDPRYEPQAHQQWVQDVFTPRFLSNPTETMKYLVAPEIRAGLVQMRESIMEEFQNRDTTQQLNGFFGSKPEWLAGKSVNDAFKEWGQEGLTEYEALLGQGIPVEAAVEMLALRRGQKPLQAAAAAAQAKDQDLLKLASGAPNRGAALSTDRGMVGEGESFGEKVANALKKQGMPLEHDPVMPRDPFKKSVAKK